MKHFLFFGLLFMTQILIHIGTEFIGYTDAEAYGSLILGILIYQEILKEDSN